MCLFPIIVFLPSRLFFSALSCCDFLRGHCARSLWSRLTSTSGPECVWQHSTKAALKTSLGFDSLLRTRKLLSRKQRICIPHLSLSSWQSNAAPQPKISERWEKTPVDSLPFTEKSNQTHRSNYTQTTHADGNCEVQMRLKGHGFPKGTDLCWNGWKCLQSITCERETHKNWFLSGSQQYTRGNYLIWNHFSRNIKSKALNVCVFIGMFGWFSQ